MRTRSVPARGSGWFAAGYAGLAGFFALEAAFRQKGSASSLAATTEDQGTIRMIVIGYVVAAELAPVLRRVAPRLLPAVAGPVGLVLEAVGLALRAWSMQTLGAHYSRTLRTEADHPLVETGPYRLVRHPGYTGSVLTWTGFALSSRSLPVVVSVAGLLGAAYRRRIT